MALVTGHQRTTSSSSSSSRSRSSSRSDGSTSDANSADNEDTLKVIDSLSECQSISATQGTTALMPGSNECLRASCVGDPASVPVRIDTDSIAHNATIDGDPFAHTIDPDIDPGMDTGKATTAAVAAASRPTSSCSSGSSSSSSDIQQHLQSMFCLLRPEETLKMAVKLESLRPGRTRYLVVVSRTVTSKRHNAGPLYLSTASNGNISSTTTTTSSISSTWPLSVTSAPITTTAGSSQQSSRPCSALALAGDPACIGPTGTDTFVSSLDNCVLSTGGRSDQCDNTASSRLSSSSADDHHCHCVDDDPRGDCSNGGPGLHPGTVINATSVAAAAVAAADGGKKIEESCLLGIDCNERTTVGLVLKVLADTSIRLDGDGGFSVSSCGKQHIFKPVSVQAMWSALQTLHKASFKAREHNFFAGGPSHDWVGYYETHIDSDRSCLNEWNAMDSLESRRPPSPGSIRSKPTEREETESVIRSKLKEVMMSVDLDDVTSKFIRGRLEELLDMDLGEYKPFIDAEMLVILGQMDAPTEIFDHVYLGSEWNASNLEELQRNGVQHILNVTREIDNFFPGRFHYCNVRVYDDEKTDLLRHWDNTFKFISRAQMEGSKVLVHCKMGISRSASVVIAYAMKANGWGFEQALRHVKAKRGCIKPNKNFLMQLETYQGMLDAMKNKEKLQRSKSETNLKLAGAKEGRSLPGSEPTPLIQALNGGGKGRQHQQQQQLVTVASAAAAAAAVVAAGAEEGPVAASAVATSSGTHEVDGEVKQHPALDTRGRTRTRQPTKQLPLQLQQPEKKQDTVTSTGDPICMKRTLAATRSQWNPLPRSVAHKRHKSLSPESPRWPPAQASYAVARTLLGLDAVELVESHTATPAGSRRKQQSYSLEHLHGGLLDIRSAPCATETKTIRMPCGNGQNYSVSPNQIVHLQDKLPASGVRKTVSSTLVTGSRTRLEDSFGIPKPVASSVKTIVSELECNSSCSNSVGATTTTTTTTSASASNIPVAPPPLATESVGSHTATGAPIPIASVAAEAAAVASANRVLGTDTVTDPPAGTGWEAEDPAEPVPRICWTSSAQIIHPAAPDPSGTVEMMRQCSWSSCDDRAEDIPWHPGTVKRTKKRIEERTSGKWTGEKPAAIATGTGGTGGMVSTSYARLSASAPDSYNLYAEPVKRQTRLNHQHSFAGPSSSSGGRVSFRGEDAKQSKQQQQQQPSDEEPFNAGKVRNLKMSFEAKSTDRPGKGQKKVRSLPSSPVAVHVAMGSQGKEPAVPTPAPPPAEPTPAATEDVTVRDLVDRYEIHGPRMRPTGIGTLGSRPQRPRSVFEPLKGGKAFGSGGGSSTSLLLSHSTTQLRLDEAARPPPIPPLVRGLVIPPAGVQYNNNNNNTISNSSNSSTSSSSSTNSNSNSSSGSSSNNNRNNNTVVGSKRTQQHGRTHPLAKIGPGGVGGVGGVGNRHHNHHHHHHHVHVHVHHQYGIGPLQTGHRHLGGTGGGTGVPGNAPPSATITANAYNTM